MAKIPNLAELLGMGGSNGLDPAQLRRFLQQANGPTNKWLDVGPYNAYLRKSGPRRHLDIARPVDLASVSNTNRGSNMELLPAGERPPKAKFQELMQLLETESGKAGRDSVYVENVLNKFLPEVLQRYGYQHDPYSGQNLPSFFKKLGGS